MAATAYGLDRVDYTDELTTPIPPGSSLPAGSASSRAIFEGAPVAVRRFLRLSWGRVLRLRLAPEHAPGQVFG